MARLNHLTDTAHGADSVCFAHAIEGYRTSADIPRLIRLARPESGMSVLDGQPQEYMNPTPSEA